jgi:Family of unknown function (DUF6056)
MRNKKMAGYFIYCLVGLLCFGYILLAFNNRYQFDDLGFSAMVREEGIWKAFQNMYYYWETIYNTLLLFFLLKWTSYVSPYVYNIPILLINIYCLFLLLKTIFQYYAVEIRSRDVFLISSLVIAISYFSCRAMGNAVYWVTGQIVYCLFLSFLFLALHFWIKQKFFLASVFMFLFAHTRINYDAIFLGLYVSYFLFYWYNNKKITFNWKTQIPLLFFLIGLITYVIIPGNYRRMDSIKVAGSVLPLSAINIMKGWISAFKHLAGIFISSWKELIILPIGVILGLYLGDNLKLIKAITPRLLIYCSLAFIISYIGQSTVIYIAIKTPVGYGRIFFFLEMLLFILILLYGIYFGILLQSYLAPKIIAPLIYVMSLIILFAVGFDYYKNYQITTVFAKAYDKRIQHLKEMKQTLTKENVYLTPLPNSEVLEFMEIAPESDSTAALPDNNAVYVRYYQLPFKIFLAK